MTTLLSFLGKGRYEKDGYRTAKYRFDGAFAREVPFFGMALDDYLKPDRLILVGTSGSMDFFEQEGRQHDESCSNSSRQSNPTPSTRYSKTHAGHPSERA
jgi:hypothetical protein